MALATRCPYCQTTFRVAHDQLKLRAGLVRCGACKEIFNGIEHLLRPGEGTPGVVPAAALTTPAPLATPAAPVESITATVSVPPPVTIDASLPIDAHAASTAESHLIENPSPLGSPISPTSLVADVAQATAQNGEPAFPASDAAAIPQAAQPAVIAERFSDTADFYPAFDLMTPPVASPAETPRPLRPSSPPVATPAEFDPGRDDPLQRMTLIQFSDDDHADDEEDFADHESVSNRLRTAADGATAAMSSATAPGGADSTSGHGGAPALIAASAHPADELDQAIDYLQRRPWRGSKKSLSRKDVEGGSEYDSDTEEPSFVTRARRRRGAASALRSWTGRLVLLLIAMALAQGTFALRDQIAVRVPGAKTWLTDACSLLGCQIELPAQAEAISIESNELTTLSAAKNTFGLTLLLRNRGAIAQRWPNIELTLLDGADRPVIRKVFAAADYLPTATELSKGFAANSEQTVRVAFELRQQKASNYRVYSFYP